MVENSLAAIRYHLENAVHIPSFYGGREDTELLCTLEQLQPLIKAVDVRDEIIRCEMGKKGGRVGMILILKTSSSLSNWIFDAPRCP